MHLKSMNLRDVSYHSHWIAGLLALLWVIVRSGSNPKRLTYPCQRAMMPFALNWLLAVAAFLTGSLLLRKFARFSGIAILALGVIWFIGALPQSSRSAVSTLGHLPVWEVPDPVSTVCVLDSIPPTMGTLAAGDSSVPDSCLTDPAIDTLLALLADRGVHLHQTAEHPDGLVKSTAVVIIKGNFQWDKRNATNTDRIKGLIWQLLRHPDGFSGEIIVCDNTQDIGTGINHGDNNSADTAQSIVDVVNTFSAKGYPVSVLDWNYIWDVVSFEYSDGDYNDGYVYEEATKISYPKFRSPLTNHYVSARYGLWDSLTATYDPSRLCIINFPVLKAHRLAGATEGIKNWVGLMTTAYSEERYGSFMGMHNDYLFAPYALVARIMAATFPKLTIIDATYINVRDAFYCEDWVNTRALVASTDPVAASWYAAKFILTPLAISPSATNPDQPGGSYATKLANWTDYFRDTAGLTCTRDSTRMSVYGRDLPPPTYVCGDANGDATVNISDAVSLIAYIFAGGQAPEPLLAGDADNNATVNISDAVYLIAYIFAGGSAPCHAP